MYALCVGQAFSWSPQVLYEQYLIYKGIITKHNKKAIGWSEECVMVLIQGIDVLSYC